MGAVPASVVLRDRDVVDEIAPPLRVVHRQHREAPESLPSMNRRSCCRGVSDNRHLLWPLQSSTDDPHRQASTLQALARMGSLPLLRLRRCV
jgi:hypothetical protein